LSGSNKSPLLCVGVRVKKSLKIPKGQSEDEQTTQCPITYLYVAMSVTISALNHFSHLLFMLFLVIYLYWYPIRFLYRTRNVSFNNTTRSATSETETVYPFRNR